jgi:hypothetical protein
MPYLVNKEQLQVVGRFAYISEAEEVGRLSGFDFTVASKEKDLTEAFTAEELVQLHNKLVPKKDQVTEFASPEEGARKLGGVLAGCEFKAAEATMGLLHKFQQWVEEGKTRPEIIELIAQTAEVKQSTAAQKYNKLRKESGMAAEGKKGNVARVKEICSEKYKELGTTEGLRKAVIAQAESEGISKATASTQYQRWKKESIGDTKQAASA